MHQNSDPFPEESSHDQFLRGSCSNLLMKKFESSNNLGSSLRNTTHFKPLKFPPGAELKKSSEVGGASFKNSGIKGGPQESPSCTLLRPPQERFRNG